MEDKELFEKLFDMFMSDNFGKKSTYYDEKQNKQFNYSDIVYYMNRYFGKNIDDEKVYLYHAKKRERNTLVASKIKNEFNEFVNGDVNYIESAINYIRKYSSKEDVELYKKALIEYYKKFSNLLNSYEENGFVDLEKQVPLSKIMHEYVLFILKEDYANYKKRKSLIKAKSYKYLTILLSSSNLEDFAREIYENNLVENLNSSKISEFISNHKDLYQLTNEEVKNLEKELTIKLSKVKAYIKKIRNKDIKEKEKLIIEKYEKEKLNLCNKLVQNYINSNFNSIKLFCEKNQISYENFKRCVNIVKKYNRKLYDLLIKTIDNQNTKKNVIITNILNEIKDGIVNGIELDDETKRPFDIIDYYMITNIPFDKLSNFFTKDSYKNNLSKREFVLVRRFISKCNNSAILKEREILKEKYTLLVNGIEYQVTENDKMEVIDYMNKNNIPLYMIFYRTVLKRYLSNNLPELTINNKVKVFK